MNGRNQPATVQQLGWMQPTYLGIQWPREQILPTPYEEIDHDEFMRLMFCGEYGLCGINYEQTFIQDPTTARIPLHCENEKCHFRHFDILTLPAADVDAFFEACDYGKCPHCGQELVAQNPEVGREQGLWVVTYYFFPDYALACGVHYTNLSDETKRALPHLVVPESSIHTSIKYGHLLRFWRIGCQHKHMTTHWAAMHDRHDNCLDCGFHAQYDTSG